MLLPALLKMNILLSAGYLIYRLLLRRLTFYTLNRFFLLGLLLAAAASPWITIDTPYMPVAAPEQAFTYPAVAGPVPVARGWDAGTWLQMLYAAGIVCMSVLVLIRSLSLLRMYRRSSVVRCQGQTLRVVPGNHGPFSFFRSIFLNPEDHLGERLTLVLQHEQVHVRQLHSMDILLAAGIQVICWCNPFSWLLAGAIRRNLEFIADDQVLKGGAPRKTYQYSLLQSGMRQPAPYLAHPFSFSHLKARIHMMNRTPSSRLRLGQFYAATGLVAGLLALTGIANGQQSKQAAATKATGSTTAQPVIFLNGKKTTAAELETMDPQTVKSVSVRKDAGAEARYGAEARQGVVLIQSREELQATRPAEPETPAADPATGVTAKPAIYIDGKKMPNPDLTAINPEQIESVSVLKGANAIAIYGEDGKNGVIEITTKP